MSATLANMYLTRRKPRASVFGLNVVALAALVVPVMLIRRTLEVAAPFAPELFRTIEILFGVGVAACALAMLLMAARGSARGMVIVLLPVAAISLVCAATLAAMNF